MLYDLIIRKDPKAALNKLKGAAKGLFNTGKAIVEWLQSSFKRFIAGIPQISFPDNFITKNFPLKFVRDLAGKKFPNPLWLINPFNMMDKLKLLKKSFFPPNQKTSEPDLSEYEEGAARTGPDGVTPQTPLISASVTKLGSGGGSLKDMKDQDWSDLAYIVSGEAARGTDDEYGVAAAVLNRVVDPRYPNTIMGVGTAPGQFEAVYKGSARRDENLAKKLKNNQSKIVAALRSLNGRTDFKGQSMLKHKGIDDVMFDPRGNFYHYPEQRKKSDPTPVRPPQHWRKLVGGSTGGQFNDGTVTTQQSIRVPESRPAQQIAPMMANVPPSASPTSPSAAAVSSISSSSSTSGVRPQVGTQGIIPVPLSDFQPIVTGGGVISNTNPDSLNSFYRAQLFGFLYKQG